MFGRDVELAARAHALEAYPEECCGLIVDNQYIRCHNVSNDCLNEFAISDEIADFYGDRIQAVIHSHAEHKTYGPSAADMECQAELGVPFGIVITNGVNILKTIWFGDFTLESPLVGREFIHGVYDCYSIIRGYYWQERGVKLPEFPRDADWWKYGFNLYLDNFKKAGFHRITAKEAREGDVFLAQIRSSVTNHGGILLSGGLALHHLDGRLSRREPIGPWANKYITHWLRYNG